MDSSSVSSSSGATALYAMKKAMETEGQGVLKLLENLSQNSSMQTSSQSSAAQTGLGMSLDIRA
ncbi:MAG: hypothetical protein AB7S65_01295 [Sulfuricurvum sp.]